jgi:hypothetical protein
MMNKKQIILNILLISWATGMSSRFIFEFLTGNAVYTTNLFDIVFDWFGLLMLGILNFAYFIYHYYHDSVKQWKRHS